MLLFFNPFVRDAAQDWFVEHTNIEPLDIAPGVSLRSWTDTAFIIRNTSGIPLYVLQRKPDYYLRDEAQGKIRTPHLAQIPPHLYASEKIVHDQVYVWIGRDEAGNERWQLSARYSRPDGGHVSPGNLSHYFDGYHSRQIRKDFRPRNVPLPPLLRYPLTVLYDNKLYQTGLIQRYTLNPSYDPIAKLRNDIGWIIAFVAVYPVVLLYRRIYEITEDINRAARHVLRRR